MSLWSSVKSIFGSDRAAVASDERHWRGPSVVGGRRSSAGLRVSHELAMSLSAYFAAIRCISEDVAKLPLVLYRRDGQSKTRAYDHPLYRLIHRAPNPAMSAMSFRELLVANAMGWGNGYAEITRDGAGVPVELWPIHPSRVRVQVSDQLEVSYEVRTNGGQPVYIPGSDMLHIHGLGPDGYQGYSVAQVGTNSIGAAMAAEEHSASYFKNGAQLAGCLRHPGAPSDKALQNIKDSWASQYSGSENAYKTPVLTEGMEFQAMSVKPEDAQLLQTRQFSVEEIARWFRIPPHKIQHLENATFSNIEQQSIEYVTDTLHPWLSRTEQEIERKLLADQPGDFMVEHLVNGLLRGDAAARGEFYSKLWNVGALSVNDIRALENLNPVDGGDTYFVPLNFVPLEQAVNGPPQTTGA